VNDAVFNKTHYTQTLAGSVQDGGATTLKVHYDAGTRSYTLTAGGLSETFAPADHVGSDPEPYRDYRRQTAGAVSFFNIGTPSLAGGRVYHYVNGGYWQRNVLTGDGGFDINFYPFAFGLPTAASDVPRSGRAGYAIDLFGFYTDRGTTAGSRVIAGDGTINVDFALAQLQLSGSAISIDLINGTLDDRRAPFTGLATIASDASFSGTFNFFSTNRFAGRFYGPGAAELGAVFWSDGQPDHFEGTIVGQRSASVTPVNFLLTELIADQEFRMTRMMYDYAGRLAYKTDGSYTYINDISQRDKAPTFRASDKVVSLSTPDYTVYRTSFGGDDYQLRLANAGNDNSLIKLHYASFGEYSVLNGPPINTNALPASVLGNTSFFTYGLTPSLGVLSPSGKGSYAGIVLGRARNNLDSWSVSGTSDFALNFQTGALDATLKMSGASLSGGNALVIPDLGIRDGFANLQTGELRGSIAAVNPVPGYGGMGLFGGQLYGPTGEELGGIASFTLYNSGGVTGETGVSVIALAKREP
jgi:hypothetical protein